MSRTRVIPILDSIEIAAATGQLVPCRVGCAACCRGPFDISPADAAMVVEGVNLLHEATRSAVFERAANHIDAYTFALPGWPAPYDVDAIDDDAFDRVCDALAALPCPALDSSGACTIYEHRPITCRLMGRGWTTPNGDVLENACPVQGQFPGYADLLPTSLDLERLETAMDNCDDESRSQGFVRTTVAGAISRQRRDS